MAPGGMGKNVKWAKESVNREPLLAVPALVIQKK